MAYQIMPARHGVAGQIAYDVRADDGSTLTLVGSEYGSPGPIVAITQAFGQIFVTDPGQYGDRFDRNWVASYLSDPA